MANSIYATHISKVIRVPLYTLSLRSPTPSSLVFGGLSYTFPLPPQALRREVIAFNTVMDVAGTQVGTGVQRIVDQFGQSLPLYSMRGTTGSKYHSMDGFVWDGVSSIQRIQSILTKFAQLNQGQINQGQGNQLYTLEFYDYYMDEYWQVVPVGPQGIEQSAQQPLFPYYNFRFACIAQVSAQIPQAAVDAVAVLLGANGLAGLSLTTQASGIIGSAVSSLNSAISSVQNFSLSTVANYL